jgi:hypothetical protein
VDVIVRPAAGVGGKIPRHALSQDIRFSYMLQQEPVRGSSSPSCRRRLDNSSL